MVSKPHESLAKIGFFRSLTPNEIELLERRCRWRHARAKEWLYELDDQGTDFYFLTRGTVRVMITPSPDRAVILTDIDTGGYFGELAAIDGQPRSAGILALSDATITCMSAPVFLESVYKHADVCEQLLRLLVARIRILTQRQSRPIEPKKTLSRKGLLIA